jgi:predicted pyridoxine 5'-phosphate oxidase superfamily flavin-nucleotide-binding protein
MKISETVKEFIQKANIIYVGTSDKDGIPHLAAGERIVVKDGEHVRLEAWFCVKTIENLMLDPAIAIAAIDPSTKDGFQLIGKMEKIEDKMMMDGFAPSLEEKWAGVPTTEYAITVTISHVLKFTTGVHSDSPLRY